MEALKNLFTSIGFTNIEISTPEEHDRKIAFTSQLAHVVSNAYIKSPVATEHAGFSAGSYKDLTRVAKLNEDMWTELFLGELRQSRKGNRRAHRQPQKVQRSHRETATAILCGLSSKRAEKRRHLSTGRFSDMIDIEISASKNYHVLMDRGLLSAAGAYVKKAASPFSDEGAGKRKICVITDENVAGLYGKDSQPFIRSLSDAGFCVFRYVFPGGESSKTLDYRLFDTGFSR